MRRRAAVVFAACMAAHATEWKAWAPRPEIAPHTFMDELHSRSGHPALAVAGDSNPAVYGGWQRNTQGIEGGKWYRFHASYRAEGLDYAAKEVQPRLDWMDSKGERT